MGLFQDILKRSMDAAKAVHDKVFGASPAEEEVDNPVLAEPDDDPWGEEVDESPRPRTQEELDRFARRTARESEAQDRRAAIRSGESTLEDFQEGGEPEEEAQFDVKFEQGAGAGGMAGGLARFTEDRNVYTEVPKPEPDEPPPPPPDPPPPPEPEPEPEPPQEPSIHDAPPEGIDPFTGEPESEPPQEPSIHDAPPEGIDPLTGEPDAPPEAERGPETPGVPDDTPVPPSASDDRTEPPGGPSVREGPGESDQQRGEESPAPQMGEMQRTLGEMQRTLEDILDVAQKFSDDALEKLDEIAQKDTAGRFGA
jgi:hypothetical protein